MARIFLQMVFSIDQLGNLVLQDLLKNLLITTRSQHSFGYDNGTISSVLGKNKATQSLMKFGTLLANFLDWIDPNHVLNSIEHFF